MEADRDLERELDEVSGHLNALHGRLVSATVEMLRHPTWWRGVGLERPQQYLCWRTGIAPERANQIVDIAERAHELPHCLARLRAGELSVDQMAVIARRAPWWTDLQISELAPKLTVWQLRRLLARYPFPSIPAPGPDSDPPAGAIACAGDTDPTAEVPPADPDACDPGRTGGDPATDQPSDTSEAVGSDADATPDPDAASADAGSTERADAASGAAAGTAGHPAGESDGVRDRMWFGFGDDGRFRLHGEVDQATGLIIEAALTEARDRLFHDGHDEVDWADAIREVAERSLDRVEGADRRDRFRVHAHLDRSGELSDRLGRALPDVIRRHITCEGTIAPVFYEGGLPISVGRSQRIVPERTRRTVLLRDQGCRVPGCGSDRFLEVHHIVHWEDWGPTETPNLISLCPHHHRMHHRGRLGISGNADVPDGVTFTNRHGITITASGARPTPPGAPPPPITGTYAHPLGERFGDDWFQFREPPAPPEPPQRPAA